MHADRTARATGYVRTIQRRDGPVFYAKLKLPDGTQPQRRLGRCGRSAAAPRWLPDARHGRGAAAAILAGDDPLVNIAPTRVTFGQACDEYLAYIEHDRKRSPSTVRDYRHTVNSDATCPRSATSTPLEDITTVDVDALPRALVDGGQALGADDQQVLVSCTASSSGRARHGLRATRAAALSGSRSAAPATSRVLAPGEVALLASKAENAQDAALFTVAAFTGLRLGELLALRWGDVDFAKRIVHVRRSYVLGREDTPKSHKVRSVPLIDQAGRRARRALAPRALHRPGRPRVRQPRRRRARAGSPTSTLQEGAERAGLRPDRLHDLRHTFGTLAVQAFPLSDVKAYMGHANIETTMRYVHHVPQHDAADKLAALIATETVHPTVHRTAGSSAP